jgi:hypothetical protein
MARARGANHPVQVRAIGMEHLAVQEQDRVHGLVLRGCRHAAPDSEVREECLDRAVREFARVNLAVKRDEAPDPMQVGVLGADGIVLEPDPLAHQIENARLLAHDRPSLDGDLLRRNVSRVLNANQPMRPSTLRIMQDPPRFRTRAASNDER